MSGYTSSAFLDLLARNSETIKSNEESILALEELSVQNLGASSRAVNAAKDASDFLSNYIQLLGQVSNSIDLNKDNLQENKELLDSFSNNQNLVNLELENDMNLLLEKIQAIDY